MARPQQVEGALSEDPVEGAGGYGAGRAPTSASAGTVSRAWWMSTTTAASPRSPSSSMSRTAAGLPEEGGGAEGELDMPHPALSSWPTAKPGECGMRPAQVGDPVLNTIGARPGVTGAR